MATSAPPPSVATGRPDAILDAAFRTFAVYGYRRVSMEDIAQAAGLSRTALYLHFRSKEDIFRSLSERYFEGCVRDLEAALAAEGPAEAVLAAAFAAKDGKFMETVLATPHGRELLDAGFAVASDIAQAAEDAIASRLSGWLAARGAEGLGEPAAVAATAMAALKGLKTTAHSYADYRAGQAMLARIVARALAA